MNEVDVNEVDVNEVDVNEVNVNTEAKEVCGVKEEMSKGKPLEIEAKVEEFSMKEVMKSQEDKEVEILPLMKEVKESRHANWDPGEIVDAKAQVEMLDAKEAETLLNIDKVGLHLFMKEVRSSCGAIKKSFLVVLFLLRFVNRCRPHCLIELSDYG